MRMSWSRNVSGEMILYVKEGDETSWKPYYMVNNYEPDYDVKNGSKGWATYQKLSRLGWLLEGDFKEKRTGNDKQ